MIKYHGTPITPLSVFKEVAKGRNLLVSWANPQDINRSCEYCDKLILDNGAFTFWNKKQKVDWNDFYLWVESYRSRIEHFFIPDIIDGTEKQNDDLIKDYHKRFRYFDKNKDGKVIGIPVWHIHESFSRLRKLMSDFPYIAIGSSGLYSKLGTELWHNRMDEVMKVVCDADGKPMVKIHMLRCLNPSIFTKYPFFSGDSTNIARNHNRYKTNGLFGEVYSGWRYLISRIEPYNSPKFYKFTKKRIEDTVIEKGLFDE